jgi:DNA-binding Lrp family transcriptional regulator
VLAATRRRQILQRLQSDGYVEAKELAVHLDVDSSTIRRDLDALAKAGQIHRTHGGARPVPHASGDIPYAVKQTEYRAEKAAIAIAAASRVRDGDTVILDSGSTTYEVATRLRDRHQLTVITNDLRIAKYVATMPDTRLLVTGGELLGAVYTLVGERAVDFLADYTADWTFLGAGNFIVLPMAFLSGAFFPMDQTPDWLQRLSLALPMRHLNDGLSAVLVRGQGVEAVLVPAAVLTAFTVVLGLIAVRVFRWDNA